MKKDNIEALKSSVLVGVAFMAVVGGVLFLTDSPYFLSAGLASLFFGFVVGLLTTLYLDEE